MDWLLSMSPIAILIFLMTRRNGTPSHVALPVVALLVYAIKLVYFEADPNLVNATVLNGLLTALTPILIISGAIFMFKTMEHTGAMAVVAEWLDGVSSNPTAQLMIIGWAFSFMIEGASGFGTPAALSAPILVGLGFPALRVAVLTLVMNTVPVSFGAVGTPTWFGMAPLGLEDQELLRIGFGSAVVHAVASLVIPLLALLAVIDWRTLRPNLGFVYLSVLACVAPYVLLARFSYEFPALFAGMIGFGASIALARFGVGLSEGDGGREGASIPVGRLVRALFPLWATVLVLLLTRIEELGIKGFLVDATPALQVDLGSLGHFSTSRSLVLVLEDIFRADSAWTFQALYTPAIIPFFLVSAIFFGIQGTERSVIARVATETWARMVHPIVALLGALVMVQLMMVGDDSSMVVVLGRGLAAVAGDSWTYAASLLGALGTFFSGSATVSNLTFGGIQEAIAAERDLDRTLVLSLQSVGAAMGNMVAINNIVAVCSILGIERKEGWILTRTVGPMLVYAVLAALIGWVS